MSDFVIVEDNDDIRETTIEFLEMEGVSAVGCSNGMEALEYLRGRLGHPPKLVVVDLRMPIMDGYEFRQEQLADSALSKIPCAVMSADGALDAKIKDLEIDDCIKKPIDLERLMELIHKYQD